MKQPDFTRKAIGLLLAPFALAALPAGATTLDVTNYDGWGEYYQGFDEENNRYFFRAYEGEENCILVGIATQEASLTVPDSISWAREYEEWNEETQEYEVKSEKRIWTVYGVELDPGNHWMMNSWGDAGSLQDLYFNDIQYVYRRTSEGPKYLHFTSKDVPSEISFDNYFDNYENPIRKVIFAPEEYLDAYKEAFNENEFFVVAEGANPSEEFEKELAGLNALAIHEDPDCVPYASWSGTDEKGTLYAFEHPYNDITFRGVITGEKSITIPDYVVVTNAESYSYRLVPVTRFCLDYYDETNNGFPGSDNLTDIYVPKDLNHAEFHGTGYAGRINFHFISEGAPEFYLYDGAGNAVNIYVAEEAFDVYAAALGDQDYMLWSETPASPVTVNVATPGTLAEEISSLIDNLGSVRWLILTGTPDEIDLRMIRRLPRLEKLDLSATTGLASVGGFNGLKYLREVALPEGITAIDNYAFNKCRNLSSVNIPDSVTAIGEYAFAESGIRSLDLSHIVELGNFAFNNSRISNVDLSAAEVIGSDAFLNTPLGSVVFGENIRELGNSAFRSANLTGVLEIPSKVKRLNDWVFAYNQDLTKIIIPKDVVYIDDDAFQGVKPEVVECHILYPFRNNGFYGTDMSNTTLYVPSLTINDYLLSDYWLDFANIDPLPEELMVVDLDRELTLTADKGIAEKAELNMYRTNEENSLSYGHLTVDRSADLNLGNYSQLAYFAYDYWDSNLGYWRYDNYYNGSTIIPESTVTADKVEVKLNLYKDRWYFLSFPFDVNVKDIVVDEDALWVVRKYDGEARANLDENTWKNMTDETVLKAGEGYIFNCAVEDRDHVGFIFTPAADGNALFANGVVAKELNEYASEFAHNASWNLVGNTYPAYLNIKAVDFEAPITVWTDNTYYAYSPVDDEYVLDPFQAFFVQCQTVEGGNAVALKPEGRAHSREAAAVLDLAEPQTRAGGVNLNRSLFNVYVKGENGMDRTRIVVNAEASFAYEANRDASKFMSTSELVPQIFVNNNNVRMAINESPLGNGQFTLGTRFGQTGAYTISLDTRNAAGYSVLLTDNVTGITTDLMAGAYTFNADAATDDNRFTITISPVSGVESAVAEGLNVKVEGNALNIVADEPVEIMVVSADGKVVVSEKSAEFSATLENGIYVVKVGNATTKVNIGK